MEAVAWLEGLPHSAAPKCTCPVIAAFVRQMNDRLSHEDRQRLVPYLPRLVGTVSPEHKAARARFLVLQAARVFLPVALDAIGLTDVAAAMRTIPDHVSYPVLRERCEAARSAASTARRNAAPATVAYTATVAYAAADAAKTAAHDARGKVADLMCATLDGLLAIGPASPGFSKAVAERVAAFRELVGA